MVSTRKSAKRKEPAESSNSRKKKPAKKIKVEADAEASTMRSKAKGKGKESVDHAMIIEQENDCNASTKEEEEVEGEEEEEEEDDDDEIDWETIHLPPRFEESNDSTLAQHSSDDTAAPVYKDVEVVMEAPRAVLKQSNWERAYQRNLREWMHHSHVVLLIAHYKLRNRWCSDERVKSRCLAIVPDKCKRLLTKDNKEATLKTGIKWLLQWWREFFELTGPGMLTVPFENYQNYYNGHKTLKEWIDAHTSDENGDYVENLEGFMQLLSTKSATSDTSAELFVAILRACGCDARLVASLQPVPYKIPSTSAKAEGNGNTEEEEEEQKEDKKPLFKFRVPSKKYVDQDTLLKDAKAKPPIVWAEVYCSDTRRWMTVDPIRGHIDKPLMMEPAMLNRSNHISYVLGLDNENRVTDITRRYTSNLDRAIRLRERPLTKREKEGGMKLWSDILLYTVCRKRETERDRLEFEDMEKQQTREVMPKAISGFKNHPLYALERHLLKYQIIHPKQPVLGSIKGEKVYPRDNVKTLSTADTFRKQGKQIKEGEQPIKMVKANAVTIEKKRQKEQAKQDGQDLMVACYGEWQTEPYVAPPVVDGKIPKNAFGNIDLFTPSMLPKGAAHIPIKGIAKLARALGIDYAEAVVDFDFVKMRAVPVINGIVVAKEQEWVLMEAWEEKEEREAVKAIQKQEKEVYIRWRKLIKGLLIKARVDQDYGSKPEEDKWSKYSTTDAPAGGFLPEEDE